MSIRKKRALALGAARLTGGAAYWDYVLAESPDIAWKLNDAAGSSTVSDTSSNNRPGTVGVSGGLTLGSTTFRLAGNTTASFDISGGTVPISMAYDPSWMNGQSMTIEAVVRMTSPSGLYDTRMILAQDAYPGTPRCFNFGVYTDADYTPKLYLSLQSLVGNTSDSAMASQGFPGNTNMHVAGTYDGTTIKIFMNGVLKASKAWSSGIRSAASAPLTLGCYSATSGRWNGNMAGFAYWRSKALSDETIAAHATVALTEIS